MRIIGINGFKRSGKGETGAAIAAITEGTLTLGFADKLKILAARSLGFIDRTDEECIELMDECKEEWIFSILKTQTINYYSEAGGVFPFNERVEWHRLTGREYLQHMGTQARKVFGADFWVDQVLPQPSDTAHAQHYALQHRYPETEVLAITDVRFENEAERILQLGGEVWEVLRPGTASDGHDSELVLPRTLITAQIDNDGTLDDLRDKVRTRLEVA